MAQIQFTDQFSIDWPNCTVKDFNARQVSDGVQIVALADCLEGWQVFEFVTSADGIVNEPPQIVSQGCYAEFHDVQFMAVADDGTDSLASYICETPDSDGYYAEYQTVTRRIGPDSQVGDAVGNLTFQSSSYGLDDYKPFLSFNSIAQSYALVVGDVLQRLDRQGNNIGGKVNLDLSGETFRVQSYRGNWYIFSQSYEGASSSYCSKVSDIGLLECHEKKLEQSMPFLSQNSQLIGSYQSYSGSEKSINLSSFNPDTCAASQKRELGLLHMKGDGIDMGLVEISDDVMGWLYFDDDLAALKIGLFRAKLSGHLLADISIANEDSVDKALALTNGEQILVLFLSNGQIHLSRGG